MAHASIAGGLVLVLLAWGMQPSQAADHWPNPDWPTATPAEVGMQQPLLDQARDYALTGGGSGYILRHGKLVASWGDPRKRYDLKSTTKSFGAIALGLAILDGKIALDDKARRHHPGLGIPPEENAAHGWLDELTILHLATHTAGFEKPGGYGKLLFRPGAKWHYSDAGPNWLAECVTLAYRQDVYELMNARVFTPLGIKPPDLQWRRNQYRPAEIDGIVRREFGSGISANVDAMARIGYLHLRQGTWNGQQILPADFVRQAGSAIPSIVDLEEVDPASHHGNASAHYGLLWWNNADGTLPNVPTDAFWSWGLYDSLIVVVPSLDLVVARAGQSWKRNEGDAPYEVLRPFLEPICLAASTPAANTTDDLLERNLADIRSQAATPADAPYPPSSVITGIEWAPTSAIIRQARGSDNWPTTWADDDALYTAYGDGKGFEPLINTKLSLGLVRITGDPPNFKAENRRAPTLETIGDGPRGKKASGMLMVDGVLYLLARNAGNAQLAWSRDHGQTWTWADWTFTTSFGCPTFLNFGRNYAHARDEFVYVYSHDHDSAYLPADGVVLARVPKSRITDRSAYEFYSGLNARMKPIWSQDVNHRRAVFTNPGRCYRTTVSYHTPSRRYLLCQILPGKDPRFAGGFGIYDAPDPWGPWTTVYYTNSWDVGPGETASIPTKWISPDGRCCHFLFSGDDHFSLRPFTLTFTPH